MNFFTETYVNFLKDYIGYLNQIGIEADSDNIVGAFLDGYSPGQMPGLKNKLESLYQNYDPCLSSVDLQKHSAYDLANRWQFALWSLENAVDKLDRFDELIRPNV